MKTKLAFGVMTMLQMGMLAACVSAVIVFSGCVSIENTRAQLASGDSQQIEVALKTIESVAVNGRTQTQEFSMKERIAFVDLLTDDKSRIEIAKKTYEDAIKFAALEKIDASKPGMARNIIETFASTFEEHIGENADSMENLLGHEDAENGGEWKALAEKHVGALNESEMLSLLGKIDEYTLVKRLVNQRLANTAQSPTTLVMYLTGRIGPKMRESLQKRLLPNVNKLTPAQVEKLLEFDDGRLKYITDRQLAELLVKRLPTTSKGEEMSKEKFALMAIKDLAYGGLLREQCERLDLAVVAAAAAKDKSIATRIADAFFNEIIMHKRKCDDNDWMLVKHTWTDRKEETAAYYLSQLVNIAGEEWFASVLPRVGLKEFDFIAKQITPAVATMAFESGKIENGYMEDALAKQLPAEKITAKIYDSLTSGLAKKTLAAKMPQDLKDEIASANEKAVERILATAKAKEGETFVLGGFYVGMPIEDATILLRHYVGQEKAVDLEKNGKDMPELWVGGQKQCFAISYSDVQNVRRFNFGPWILRKFCDYNAQDENQWAFKFMEDKRIEMSPKTISEADTIHVDLLEDDHTVTLVQNTWQHKDGAKKFRLIYFGKQHLTTDSTDNIANMAIRDRALKYYSSICAPEGYLRLEVYKE